MREGSKKAQTKWDGRNPWGTICNKPSNSLGVDGESEMSIKGLQDFNLCDGENRSWNGESRKQSKTLGCGSRKSVPRNKDNNRESGRYLLSSVTSRWETPGSLQSQSGSTRSHQCQSGNWHSSLISQCLERSRELKTICWTNHRSRGDGWTRTGSVLKGRRTEPWGAVAHQRMGWKNEGEMRGGGRTDTESDKVTPKPRERNMETAEVVKTTKYQGKKSRTDCEVPLGTPPPTNGLRSPEGPASSRVWKITKRNRAQEEEMRQGQANTCFYVLQHNATLIKT